LVRPEEIQWIEADDNYVVVHLGARTYKGRGRIGDLEAQLDTAHFVSVHRSAIVHVASIREVQPLSKGDLALVLHDRKVLRVARGRRAALEAALGIPL
jgi:two-component system LytT family response regulator